MLTWTPHQQDWYQSPTTAWKSRQSQHLSAVVGGHDPNPIGVEIHVSVLELGNHNISVWGWERQNIHILHWNCASAKQRWPIIEKRVCGADVGELHHTLLADGEITVAGFNSFYNMKHLGQTIYVRDDMLAEEVDISAFDWHDVQVIGVQSRMPMMIVNIFACNGMMDTAKWRRIFDHEERNIIFCGDFNTRGRL